MVTTNSDVLADKLRRLRDHGAGMSDLQRHLGARPYLLADHPDAGYNQRMTDLQAVLGSAQMERAQAIVTERQRLAAIYDRAFKGLNWLQTPAKLDGYEHGYQSYPCLFQPESINADSIPRVNGMRNAWMDKLQKRGISTRPATHAVHMLTFYREKYGLIPEDFMSAYAANHCSISLPLFHGMTDDEQSYVIDVVVEGFEACAE
jgi:dTDP-4-amino-4,6-dideoxygalactose transaminase